MTKLTQKIFGTVVLVLAAFLAVMTVFMPKKDYSETENRYLASAPELSFQSIKDTSFMDGLENYISDHFAFRDVFMTLRTKYEMLTGRNQVNGIYICDGDFCIPEAAPLKNDKQIIKAIERLEDGITGADLHIMLVPTAVTLYESKLPAASKGASQTEEIADIYDKVMEHAKGINDEGSRHVDTTDVLGALSDCSLEEPAFYRLDHHWTTPAAYHAYAAYCAAAGETAAPRSAFEEKVVTDDFRGTFDSKLNDPSMKSDSITAFYSKDARYTVTYEDTGLVTDTPYAEEYLEKKDKYSFFLNNLHPLVTVENSAASTDKELVLIKDSYANCMVPMLAQNYRTVYVFDTRYYKESVTDFINAHENVTDVLFLYNMYTIDTDMGIMGIK